MDSCITLLESRSTIVFRSVWPFMKLVQRLLVALLACASLPAGAESAPDTRVRVDTSLGSFVLALDPVHAPLSTGNFLEYVRSGHYDRTIFHRVVTGFVIQGGGYTLSGREKRIRPEITNESRNGLLNRRGTVALARFAGPHTAAAQFFVNLADNAALDPPPDGWGYTVFGSVVEGMDVVDRIGGVPTGAYGDFESEAPLEPVIIEKVEILEPATVGEPAAP
jgi:peptidyl-prolyl cis-trans isomerase A (cyclophilin A)